MILLAPCEAKKGSRKCIVLLSAIPNGTICVNFIKPVKQALSAAKAFYWLIFITDSIVSNKNKKEVAYENKCYF